MAYLSAATVESGRSVHLEVLNWGPDAAVLTGVDAPNSPTFLVKSDLPVGGVRLQPRESHRLFVSPARGEPGHVRLVVSWIDDSGPRRRTIYLSTGA